MIRIGFIGIVSKEWMGGVNYFKNLLFAIHSLKNRQIEPIIFVGHKTDKWIKEMFSENAQVIEHSLFDRKSLQWYLWKITFYIFKSSYFLEKILKKHQIQLLSHSGIVNLKTCKTANWIPDLQHLHLPGMFSNAEIDQRNKNFMNLARNSDVIILSSYDALKDFSTFAPDFIYKANVLQFVSQPNPKYYQLARDDENRIRATYNIRMPFFYLPNQFWAHKNHKVVFEAVKILKEEGREICIVCTGHMNDYRNTEYITQLQDYLSIHQLQNNIRLLGLIPYEDVFSLIKFSIAVINPSLFEGWSSSVEECKSVGKKMILSDLDVHKEQYPDALFFERNNPLSLARCLTSDIALPESSASKFMEKTHIRTQKFALTYQDIILKTICQPTGNEII